MCEAVCACVRIVCAAYVVLLGGRVATYVCAVATCEPRGTQAWSIGVVHVYMGVNMVLWAEPVKACAVIMQQLDTCCQQRWVSSA